MKITSEHIPFAKLADLAENLMDVDNQTESIAHLSTCKRCASELQRLEQVVLLMRTDADQDAPRDVISHAVNIFRQRGELAEPSLGRRILAVLTFDSTKNLAPAFGVRSGQLASRQLLYSAGLNDVDLRITPQDDRWVIAGQVLGDRCAAGDVTLEGEAGSATAAMNDLCEFSLPPVPPGSYTLLLRLADTEVEVRHLELKA